MGHFRFRDGTEAGLELDAAASQLVVVEAKMSSKLARGTTRARDYDQAARNVACMAWAVDRSPLTPSDFESMVFQVWAPQERLKRDSSFQLYLQKKSLIAKVTGRVDEYKCDPERHDELVRWLEESFLPLMARIEVAAIPWEKVIAGFSEEDGEMVAGFYEHCLVHNRPNSTSR